MRLALSFVLPLLAVLAVIAYATIPLFDSLMLKWAERDLEARATIVGHSLSELISEVRDEARVKRAVTQAAQDERLYALALCGPRFRFKTGAFPARLGCDTPGGVLKLPQGSLHVAHFGDLLLVHDMSLAERRSSDTRKYLFYLFATLSLVISIVTVVVARLNLKRFVTRVTKFLREGPGARRLESMRSPELRPLARDLRSLMREIEQEKKTRFESGVEWTPQALKRVLNEELAGDEIMIVSNREPYSHIYKDGHIEAQFPASGLVTALEPVMRACSGTWIAHGSGSADRETVDKDDHVQVPPGNPTYQIRRVWFTKEEEKGYYSGFSNEGLWPLCHMAHTRPVFRTEDWEQYQAVNAKFARAVVEEARTENPVILVQDYHLALLPRYIREKLPLATIITFWHIPWPNPEAFGICPWREQILEGLLGSSILGFHTRYHCHNFVDTVDRYLESRIDREEQTISYGGELTAIKSYPISIEWPARFEKNEKSIAQCRRDRRLDNGLREGARLGVGVDRLDYTKGILERFAAVERLLEKHPEWIGQFTFLQIAAPSRSSIEPYQNFEAEVRAAAARINQRFGRPGYEPIILKIEHHGGELVFEYFRACDVCVVTSLHDGMNLVAKEFAAARDDDRGVLILSQFTGAARELQTALIVNPYDADQCASAIHFALNMSPDEQRDRMRSMRQLIEEHNVYRWAGRMLIDAGQIRQRRRLMDRLTETESARHP